MGDATLGRRYGGVLGLPLTFLIDRNGIVRAKFQGETDPGKIEPLCGVFLLLTDLKTSGPLGIADQVFSCITWNREPWPVQPSPRVKGGGSVWPSKNSFIDSKLPRRGSICSAQIRSISKRDTGFRLCVSDFSYSASNGIPGGSGFMCRQSSVLSNRARSWRI